MRLEASLKKAEEEAENETKPTEPDTKKKGRGIKKDKLKREPLEPKSIPI